MASVFDLFTLLDQQDALTFHSNMMKTLTISKTTRFLNYDVSFLNEFYKDEKPVGGLLPYSEICNFYDAIKNNQKPRIKVKLDPKDFMLKSWSSEIANSLVQIGSQERMGTGTIYKDDTVIRLSNVNIDETGAATLHCQKAKYSDQVKSNLIVDFTSKMYTEADSLRYILRVNDGQKLPALSDKRMANTLGLACILFYWDNEYWTPLMIPRPPESLKAVSVFEGGWHCSASGAAEWPAATEQEFFEAISNDMLREIHEEIGIEKNEIHDFDLVAICREFARAGKPQLFFTGFVNLDFKTLMMRIDKARETASLTGNKIETLKYPIFRRNPSNSEFFQEIQTRDNVDVNAKKTIKPGITTEGATALYYAAQVLKIRKRTPQSGPYKLDLM